MHSIGICLALLVAGLWAVESKTFTRCELAQTLLGLGFPRSQLGDWVCLAESESGRTTTKTNLNKNKSKDFGIFQINNKYWCSPPATGGCKIPCQSLLNDDISDDAKCAKTIYKSSGFKAWYGWRAKCQGKNTAVYLRGCNL